VCRRQNAGSTSHPVGRLLPNDLGLFDMLGNNFEWCQEIFKPWSKPREGKAIEDTEDPNGIRDQDGRVLRSGSFSNPAMIERSAYHTYSLPANRISDYGFRPARTLLH
jgi:eukaryotic-like serine/threonine-protein kinase